MPTLHRLLMLFIVPLVGLTVAAQKPEQTRWHWAYDESDEAIVAYSSDGEVNQLLSNIPDARLMLWRISDNQAVGFIGVEGEKKLYILTNNQANEVTFMFDDEPFNGSDRWYPEVVDYTDNYLFITVYNPDSELAISNYLAMLNVTTQQLHLLSDTAQPTVRISRDKSYVRYIHTNATGEDIALELRERSLSDNVETVLHQTTMNGFVLGDSDIHGERWLFLEQSSNIVDINYFLYSVFDNTFERIYQRDPESTYHTYHFIGDDLIWHMPVCEADCPITILPPDSSQYELRTPEEWIGGINTFYRSRSGDLTIAGLDYYWRVVLDGSTSLLGYRYFVPHVSSSQSPSNRYALLADTRDYPPTERYMMDFETGDKLFDIPDTLEDPLYMTYLTNGFIVNSHEDGSPIAFHYTDGSRARLPTIDNGYGYDILSDGSILYSTQVNDVPQLMRYDPATDTEKVLLEDVAHIRTIDVRLLVTNIHQS